MYFKFQSDSINTFTKFHDGLVAMFFKFQSDSINTSIDLLCNPKTMSFKFQSDSINTQGRNAGKLFQFTLNSNLILLIHTIHINICDLRCDFKFQSDSINTETDLRTETANYYFKFQSDSINTPKMPR